MSWLFLFKRKMWMEGWNYWIPAAQASAFPWSAALLLSLSLQLYWTMYGSASTAFCFALLDFCWCSSTCLNHFSLFHYFFTWLFLLLPDKRASLKLLAGLITSPVCSWGPVPPSASTGLLYQNIYESFLLDCKFFEGREHLTRCLANRTHLVCFLNWTRRLPIKYVFVPQRGKWYLRQAF